MSTLTPEEPPRESWLLSAFPYVLYAGIGYTLHRIALNMNWF